MYKNMINMRKSSKDIQKLFQIHDSRIVSRNPSAFFTTSTAPAKVDDKNTEEKKKQDGGGGVNVTTGRSTRKKRNYSTSTMSIMGWLNVGIVARQGRAFDADTELQPTENAWVFPVLKVV